MRYPLGSVQLLLIALACAAPLAAQQPPAAAPRATTPPLPRHGVSLDRLQRLDDYLKLSVDSQWIAGAVALVMRDGDVIYDKAVGFSDLETRRPMTTDAIFRIASQTKALTSAAIMQLVEEGRIALTDPASKWLPTFASTTVAVRTDTGTAIVPARRRITIFDLLTHTAGISYGQEARVADRYRAAGLGPAAGWGWYTADKDEPICTTIDRLGTLPFVAQPGETFVYGYNTDILGCIVERASGMPLDRFLKERITGPLGMRDTDFFLSRDKQQRLATVYTTDGMGHVVRADTGARGQGHYVDGPRRNFSGGAGLTSTARDYARFLEAMRLGGALGGVRILSPRAVGLMSTNQVGTRYNADGGTGYGLAFATTERLGANGFTSVGSYNWGGAYGSIYYVDPTERLVMVLMLQNVPTNPDVRAKFATFVYQALTDGKQR